MRAQIRPMVSADWSQLLMDAVETPGTISSAYTRFWNYSVGNQLLAWFECLTRGIPIGPIHTFRGWLKLGRHVKKGEKAITLCMPVSVKKKRTSEEPAPQPEPVEGTEKSSETITVFTFKPRWFVLSQTEGDPYTPVELPQWIEGRALETLRIERIEFEHLNGNCQGFATMRKVAISPIAVLPHKTLFHELAHVVLGHTEERLLEDHELTPVSDREVEAECVALICCESLGLPGIAECRGYIQHWMKGTSDKVIPSVSAQRIFRAADLILKAGYPEKSTEEL